MHGFFKTAKQTLRQAQTAQGELIAAFEAVGVNFIHLDPVIYGALMNEAMVLGTETAFTNFIRLTQAMREFSEGLDEDRKPHLLREYYRARGKEFADRAGPAVAALEVRSPNSPR